MAAPQPDHTDAYFALAGVLGGTVLGGLLALVQQRLQRAHERANEDRAHLRDLLDSAADRFDAAVNAIINAESLAAADADKAQLVAANEARTDQVVALYAMERKLKLRVKNDSRIGSSYTRAVDGLRDRAEALKGAPPVTDEMENQRKEASARASVAWIAFTEACRALIGVEVE
jgi:hypothetical protein